MISVLLGLVVAAVLTATIFNQFNDSRRSARIDEAVSQITTIVGNAQKSFGAANQYASVNTARSVQSGVIPERMRTGTTTARNVYVRQTTLVAQTLTVAGDGLRLTYPIRGSDCMDVVLSVSDLMRRIQTTGTGAVVFKPLDGVVSLNDLQTACGSSATAFITIAFDFGKR